VPRLNRTKALRTAAAELNLPTAYSTTISGRGRELERTFREFLWTFLLSIIFMYMILARAGIQQEWSAAEMLL